MTFAAPPLLAALALLVPVLIAFLVRRRREVLRVPSTLLFRLAAEATAQNRRIRNLRRLASLVACLLGVAGLVLAAARPAPASRGETIAVVVDVSASMDAGGSASPFAEARRFLRKLAASAGPGDRLVIVAAGKSPARLAGPAAPGPTIDEAIDKLAVERGGSDRAAALELAATLVEGEPGARVVLLRDGGEPLGDAAPELRGVPVTERVFMLPARDNLGISAFASRPPADAASDDERELLISVATSSERPRAARIIVSAEGHELARRVLQVPALGEAEVRVRVRAAAAELSARVAPDDGIADALGRDDEATITAGFRAAPRVILLEPKQADGEGAPGAFFAEKALQAAGVREFLRAAPDLDGVVLAPGDVVVALGSGPTHAVDAPVLYLGSRGGALPVPSVTELTSDKTHLRSLAATDALLRGVALDGTTIAHALVAKVPEGARGLVELDGGTALIAGGAGHGAWIWVGIEPANTDLVLRVAFPVLVANALASLGGAADVVVADTVARGEIALRAAKVAPEPLPLEPEAPFRLPASPAAILAALAAALLTLEAWAFQRGWAS